MCVIFSTAVLLGTAFFLDDIDREAVIHYTDTIIIIIKRISRAPIYHTKWQHRALYNNTNHTHAHTHTHTHTHT